MKLKNYFSILCILTLLFFLPSCNKDDSDVRSNEFALNGETYKLSKGFLQDWGENSNDTYDFDIILTSSSINYSDGNEEFNGFGDFVYLDLNSSSESGLVNGTYIYSSNRGAFTLVDASVGTDYELSSETGDDFKVLGGSVDVKIEGNVTTLDFDLTISNNTTVSGNFSGNLRKVN